MDEEQKLIFKDLGVLLGNLNDAINHLTYIAEAMLKHFKDQ